MESPPRQAYSLAMKSLRLLLNSFVGLALLVQGVAIAATPYAPAAADETAAQESATAEMPCHGKAKVAEPADQAPCACCDGDCPNMSACAAGHFAAVPPIKLQLSPVRQAVLIAPDRSAESVALPFRLRPPISHA